MQPVQWGNKKTPLPAFKKSKKMEREESEK